MGAGTLVEAIEMQTFCDIAQKLHRTNTLHKLHRTNTLHRNCYKDSRIDAARHIVTLSLPTFCEKDYTNMTRTNTFKVLGQQKDLKQDTFCSGTHSALTDIITCLN